MNARAADVLRRAVLQLKPLLGAGTARDMRLLMAHALQVEMDRLTLVLMDPITEVQTQEFNRMVALRADHMPVSQIIGKRLFWGRWFTVNGDVLDPRPETETLIAMALEMEPARRILDLGLGSGCILLTVLAELPNAQGVGLDVCQKALKIATENAQKLGVSGRVEMLLSNWFDMVAGQFDLILSNPPYITDDEMRALAPDVGFWEPKIALTPGGDGLASYRIIAGKLAAYLTENGTALFEIGHKQGKDVCDIFCAAGFQQVEIFPDMNGHDRVVRVRH